MTFYGTAVPNSGLQLQAVAGTAQVVVVGQSMQMVMVRVTDLSTPANPVAGANVIVQSTVERSGDGSPGTGGDTTITRSPTPVVLSSSLSSVTTDANGLASFQPSSAGFEGALQIVGAATAGSGQVPFILQVLPPMPQ